MGSWMSGPRRPRASSYFSDPAAWHLEIRLPSPRLPLLLRMRGITFAPEARRLCHVAQRGLAGRGRAGAQRAQAFDLPRSEHGVHAPNGIAFSSSTLKRFTPTTIASWLSTPLLVFVRGILNFLLHAAALDRLQDAAQHSDFAQIFGGEVFNLVRPATRRKRTCPADSMVCEVLAS